MKNNIIVNVHLKVKKLINAVGKVLKENIEARSSKDFKNCTNHTILQ